MALFDSTNWFGKNIAQPVAAGAIRVGAAGLDAVGADRSAQGYYRQASNITNPNKTMGDGTTLSNGLPLVNEYASTGGLPPRPAQQPGGSGTQTDPRNTDPTPKAPGNGINTGLYRGQATTALDDLLNAFHTQQQGIDRQYGTQANQMQSAFDRNQRDYKTSVDQQNSNLLQQQNQVMQGASSAYRNLMNMLGAYGGGASSVAQEWAPAAAQNFQNAQLGAAGQNTADNLRSLSTTFGDYQNEFEDKKKQMEQNRLNDLAKAQGAYEGTKTKLQRILDSLTNGTADNTVGTQLANIEGTIPTLKLAPQVYTGEQPTYAAPSLSSFAVANTPSAQFSGAMPGNSSVNSYFLGDQQRRQNNPLAFLLDPRRQDQNVAA